MRLVAVGDTLPEGFGALREAAGAEGMRHLDRLADEFAAGIERFVPPARLLLAEDDLVVGCGGITRDPHVQGALRMRRFYVLARARGRGVARAIAEALLAPVPPDVPVLVHAGYAGAPSFWERIGFIAEPGAHHTHRRGQP